MRNTILRNTLLAVLALTGTMTATADDNVYVWKGGHVIQVVPAAGVDKVSMASGNSAISVALKQGNPITAPTAQFDSITFVYNRPISDEVLDVQFEKDGTATDISPFNNTIEKKDGSGTLSTYYNDDYGCYVGKLDGINYNVKDAFHYEVDYTDNADLWNALADGFTVELLAEGNADSNGDEGKWFSSTQGSGPFSIFVLSDKDNKGGRVLGFIASTDATSEGGKKDYRWAYSKITYQKDTYYHMVAVYDKENKKAKFYINGDLVSSVDAPGTLTKPNDSKDKKTGAVYGNKKIVFGDPGGSHVEASFPGEIAIARIYNTPMTDADVQALYSNIKKNKR